MAETDAERRTSWRVPRSVPALKLAGAVGLLALGLLLNDGDPVRLGLAVLAAAGLLAWAVRDVTAPVRLAVDRDGIWVTTGYLGRRRLDWARIERIRVDRRPRLGLRTEVLEIDAGDDLHLFGRSELGAAPEDVLGVLRAAQGAAG